MENKFNNALQPNNEAQNKSKKSEQIREVFTVVFLLLGFLIIQLPLPPSLSPHPEPINKVGVYLVGLGLVVFAFIWHRLVPRTFLGEAKFFVESVVYQFAITILIAFAGGVYSYFTFTYYLSILNISANLNRRYSITLALLTTGLMSLLLFQPFVQNHFSNDFPNALSIYILNVFGIWLVMTLGRFLANEVVVVRQKEEEFQVEQIRELDKLKDEFVFIIAHELRSPITAIRGYLELITTDPSQKIDPVLKTLLLKSFSTSNKLANLVSLLLEVARLETNKIRFYLQKIDLKPSVDFVLGELKREIEQKELKISYNVEADNIVLIDKERLEEIINIVVENAIKFTPEFGRINISTQRTEKHILLVISDTGVGVPNDIKARLFEKYYTENSNTGEVNIKGYGVSLFVAKQLLIRMNGDITCESVLGKGTTFTLSLPKYWSFGTS